MLRYFFLTLLTINLLLLSYEAHAVTNRFSILYHPPAASAGDLVTTQGSLTLGYNQVVAFTRFDYGYHPLETTTAGVRTAGVTDHLAVQYLGVGLGINKFWDVEVMLPVIWYNRFANPVAGSAFSNEMGVGDVLLRTRFSFLNQEKAIGLGLAPFLTVPTGNENNFVAEKRATGGAEIIFDADLGKRLTFALNAGILGRQHVVFRDFDTKIMLLASGGLKWKIAQTWNIDLDVATQTPLLRAFRDQVTTPTEALAQVSHRFKDSGVNLSVGGGYPIIRGAGEPMFRGFVGLSYNGAANFFTRPE